MNQKISKIIYDLEEVKKLLELSAKSENISQIEQDIVKNKLQQIYEKIMSLSVMENKEKKIPEQSHLKSQDKNIKEEENKKTAPEAEDIMQLDEEKVAVEKENSELKQKEELASKPETKVGKEILAERYRKNQKYINELLAQGYHKQDISSLMQSKPIKDIEAAIGINEKFLFVRELFSNDEETYLKTIRNLNNSPNFNAAFNYIHSTFNWNLEGEAAQKLLELVRRRFIVEED